jgi:hypothetical protein
MKISIFNLLMVLTAVAAILGLYSSRQANFKSTQRYELLVAELKVKLAELEDQNKALRQELGSLTITDPKQIHAVKLRTTARKTWSFRVYLPEGANYYFACQINSLPLEPNPPTVLNPPGTKTISSIVTNSVGIGVPPGEYVVTLSIQQANAQWEYKLNVRETGEAGDGDTGGSMIVDADGKWPNAEAWNATGGVSNQVELAADRLPLVLLDYRAMNGDIKSSSDSDQGAMLWVGIGP